jgi:hypothetical protein
MNLDVFISKELIDRIKTIVSSEFKELNMKMLS